MREDKPSDSNLPPLPDPRDLEITDEKYKELHDISIEMVEDTIVGKVKAMAPVLFVHFRKFNENMQLGDLEHAVVVIAEGFGENKRGTLFKIGERFEEEKMVPAAVFMGAESWMSLSPKPGLMPRDDPDREDVIVISGRSIGKECKSITMIPISYDKDEIIQRRAENTKHPDAMQLEQPLLDQFFYGFFDKARKRNEREQSGKPDSHRR